MKPASNKPYSGRWDKLLNYILDNGVETSRDAFTITFKVPVKKKFLGLFPYTSPKYYEVWIANKQVAYASLYRVNGVTLGYRGDFSPGEETIEKLYNFETTGKSSGIDFFEIPN